MLLKQVILRLWAAAKKQVEEEKVGTDVKESVPNQVQASSSSPKKNKKKKKPNDKGHGGHSESHRHGDDKLTFTTIPSSPEEFSDALTSPPSLTISHLTSLQDSEAEEPKMSTAETSTVSSEHESNYQDAEDPQEISPEEQLRKRIDAIALLRARANLRRAQSEPSTPGDSPVILPIVGPSMDTNKTFSEASLDTPSEQQKKKKRKRSKNKKKKKKRNTVPGLEDPSTVKRDVEPPHLSAQETLKLEYSPSTRGCQTPVSVGSSALQSIRREEEKSEKLTSDSEASKTVDMDGTVDSLEDCASDAPHMTEDDFPPLPSTPRQSTVELSKKSEDAEQSIDSEPANLPGAIPDNEYRDNGSESLHRESQQTASKETVIPPMFKGQANQESSSTALPILTPIHETGESSEGAEQDRTGVNTPASELSNTESPSKKGKEKEIQVIDPVSKSSKTESSSIKGKGGKELLVVKSHVHPAARQGQSQPPSGQRNTVPSQRRSRFFWQLDSHGFPCQMPDCNKRCCLWDGSVVCPRCGPFSEIRYCSKEHLFAHIKQHWLTWCAKLAFKEPYAVSCLPTQLEEGMPMIPCRHHWDTPERQRQAVHYAMNTTGDYFIFADWLEFVAAGSPEDKKTKNELRCSSKVIRAVRFDDPAEKDRFRRILAICLFNALEFPALVGYMFRLIRDNLRARGEWNSVIDNSPGYCTDEACNGEYGREISNFGASTGFRQLCEFLEANFWVLRAARTTHPKVTQVAARTRGEGFPGVHEKDRRMFRRGPGWDGGADCEPLEIEWPMVKPLDLLDHEGKPLAPQSSAGH